MNKTELHKSETRDVVSENKEEKNKKIILKVCLSVSSIVAGIVILAILFSIFLLPVYKYKKAENFANKGDYATAATIMQNTIYKDSKIKYGEYACIAAEKYYNDNDIDNAFEYFKYAYNSSDEDSKLEAIVYFYKINSGLVNYSEELVDKIVKEADKLYSSDNKEKAKIYYNYALNSQNEDIRNKAETRINE